MNDVVAAGALLEPIVVERFSRLGVALAIGLLIGVERGWKERDAPEGARSAGVRTFALLGLLGGALGMLGQELGGVVTAFGLAAAAGVVVVFDLRASKREGEVDATPAVAALTALALGALAGVGFLRAAAAAGVAATLLLALKEGIHRWLERLTFEELRAILLLAAMTVILLPLLPDASIGPWGGVNPRAIWLMTILIAGVSFAGYVAIRVAGPGRGPLLAGLAGGLVSSTATVVSFAKRAKAHPARTGALVAGVVAANAVMFARIGLVAGVLRPELATPLALTLGPAAVAGAAAAAWLVWRAHAANGDDDGAAPDLRNPLDLPLALKFGALLAVISLAASALETFVGAAGVFALAAVSGLADVDAMTLAMASPGAPSATVAVGAILIVATANTVSKAALAWGAGGRRVAITVAVTSLAALAAMGAGALFWMRFA